MLWKDCVGDTIRVAQQETTTKLIIPLHDDLAELVTLCRRETSTILSTVYKKPFSVKGFGNIMSDAIRAAGLPPRCVPHGLRKAAARRLAEAGCSASEIMAITGHKTLAEVERYTRAAEQERLARRAIKRQTENKSGKLVREELANDQNDLEIASIISRVALPTGPSEVRDINDLTPGLGEIPATEFQRVSAMAPKPFPQPF
jgi:hypothetical protein